MKLRSIARSSLAALWLAATVAFGQAAAETPAAFIERLGNDAIGALQNPNLTTDQRSEAFRRILEEGFDMEAMGRFVLGRHWRAASEMERQEYLALFRERIFRIFESRLSQFSGEAVKVLGVTPRSSDVTVVKTELTLMPFPPIQVDWHVATTSDIHKVIDVFVQGVSETMTHRNSFGATIQCLGKGLEGLLVVLRENVAAQTSC